MSELEKVTAVGTTYDASEIQVLEGLEAVRKRPGMYIGSTSASGLHHLVYEIVDNAIDEALAGYCTEITVTINPGDTITVTDNGRGIPVDIQKQTGRPALEVVYTVLHAGGKFGGGGYKVSGGLHGVGASVVNALSQWLEVQVQKDGKIYEMKFSRGGITQEMTVLGETTGTGTAVISVKLTEAQFEGQTKAKLGNASIRTLVDNVVSDQLAVYLEEHPVVARTILDKALTANRAREAARKARESIRRKTALGGAAMPDKLRDCNENNPELTEIYIVEGDSAGGSATQGRDSRFQAILPLWGKMLNVEKARADKVYGNDKLQPVITALGAGIGDELDLNRLRYHKIIIMADADVDGAHIRTLLLTFFFRFMRPLIEEGYVYSAVPPLYKLTRGKQQRVAYTDEERDAISAEMRSGNPHVKIDISRFKGLGEMNPHELWETTMDPEKRTLRRITLDDAVAADATFTVLMGEKVEPRKEFIEKNAKYAVNLDY